MELIDLAQLANGTILKIADDGKKFAGQAGQLRKISDKGNAALLVAGQIVWVKPERLSK